MTAAWHTGSSIAAAVLQIAFVVAGAPLLSGTMRRVRCRMEGRVGPPVRQPWLDIKKLSRKERLAPTGSGWLFSAAPVVLVGSSLVVVAVSPLVSTEPILGKSGDLFAVVFLLLSGSVLLALGGLETGTAFGGMGASRAMTIGALAEPALLVAILALSIPAHSSNLDVIVGHDLSHPLAVITPQHLLTLGAFVIVILAECGRLPVDNPATHLELTMVHEAMTLEYAGPDLALVKLGGHLRLAILLGLCANLFLPWGIATSPSPGAVAVGALVFAAKVVLLGSAIAACEVFTAKLRLFRVPELLAGAFVLAVISAATSVVQP